MDFIPYISMNRRGFRYCKTCKNKLHSNGKLVDIGTFSSEQTLIILSLETLYEVLMIKAPPVSTIRPFRKERSYRGGPLYLL